MEKMTATEIRKVMQQYEVINKNKVLQSCNLLDKDWENDDNPTWDFSKRAYRVIEKSKANNKIKQKPVYFTIWKDDRNRVYVDNNLFSILRVDKKLSILAHNPEIKLYDHYSGDMEDFEYPPREANEISINDINSLIMVNKFLAKIASGVRSPSDKENAQEMKTYLTSFLQRNNINL